MQKASLQSLLDAFPEEVDLDEFLEQALLQRKLELGEQQIASGEVVEHEQAKQRLARWLN